MCIFRTALYTASATETLNSSLRNICSAKGTVACQKVQFAFERIHQQARIACSQRVSTCMLASHVLVTCTFLSAVTPLQYFLTRFLMQIFFSISDVCIKTKKGKKKRSEAVQTTAPAVLKAAWIRQVC